MQESAALPTIGDTMQDPNVYRELGALTAKVGALEISQSSLRTEVKGDMAAINAKLDTLLQRDAASSGARKMLWKVGAASGGGTGLLVAIASWWVDTFGGRGGSP